MKYEEISYDVWGNVKDGFDVNNKFHTRNYVELSEKALKDDKTLVKELKKQDVLKKGLHFTSVGIDGDEDTIYISDARNGRPEFELQRIKEELK